MIMIKKKVKNKWISELLQKEIINGTLNLKCRTERKIVTKQFNDRRQDIMCLKTCVWNMFPGDGLILVLTE